MSAVLTTLCIVSFILGLASLYRVCRIGAWKAIFQIAVHIAILIYLMIMAVYYGLFDYFWLYLTFEFLKITVLFGITSYFSLSLLRFHICPECITQSVTFFGLFAIYLPCIVTYVLSIYYHVQNGCGDLSRVILASFEVFTSLAFCIETFLILNKVERRASVSGSYMVKHVVQMAIIMVVFCFSCVANLTIRAYIYYIATQNGICSTQKITSLESWEIWVYLVFSVLEIVVPTWTLYWYFYATFNNPIKRKSTFETSQEDLELEDDFQENPMDPNYLEIKEILQSDDPGLKISGSFFVNDE